MNNGNVNAAKCKGHTLCCVGNVVLCTDMVSVETGLGCECGGVVLL